MRKYLTPLVGVTATVIALTGCSSSETPPAHQNQQSPATDTESDTPQDSAQSATQDTTHEFLDVLYSEELHTDVQTAAPGTAYIEVAGERFELAISPARSLNSQAGSSSLSLLVKKQPVLVTS